MTSAFVLIWTDFVWRMILSYEKWGGVTSRAFTWDSIIIRTTINGRPLAKKEQRTVIYVRDMVTGLTFKPRPVEFQRGSIGLQASVAKVVFALWERFKTPKIVCGSLQGRNIRKETFDSITDTLCKFRRLWLSEI